MKVKLTDLQKKSFDWSIGAGKILLKYQKKISKLNIQQKDKQGVVSEADLHAENYLIKEIKKYLPESQFLAEESAFAGKSVSNLKEASEIEWLWVIDPLDGTTNFLSGMDYFVVCIGLLHYGKPVLGTIYRPHTGEIFTAIKGKGAFHIDGKSFKKKKIEPIHSPKKIKDCVFVTGFATEKGVLFNREFDIYKRLMVRSRGIRRMGSAALDITLVCTGIFDGFWERGLSPWDTMAVSVIAGEVGLKITNYSDQDYHPFQKTILVGSKVIHKQLRPHFK